MFMHMCVIWFYCYVFFCFRGHPDGIILFVLLAHGSHPSSVAASERVSFFMSLTIRKIAAFFCALGVTLICFKALSWTETDSST